MVLHQQDAQRLRSPRLPLAAGCRSGRGSGCRAAADGSGSRTVNVAPLPLPSLWASIVPPCISTRALLMASPSPSPPNCRVMRALRLLEGVEDARQRLRLDAHRRCR